MGLRISLEEATARALGAAQRLDAEAIETAEAAGRVLAEDVRYERDLPPFAHAAMDGYALAGACAEGTTLAVRGEARAGVPSVGVGAADVAVAISTGAALPAGTSTVVPWEDVERDGERITLRRAARAGQHVRAAGEDVRAGSLAVGAGTRIAPRHVAMLAMADRPSVRVTRRPRALVVSTGDELVEPGAARRPGQIVDSNGPMIASLAAQARARTERGRLLDREGAIEAAVASARGTHDLVVTVGGAADGDHDHVVRAMAALGAEWIFRGVAIKPGKPVGLARLGSLLVLALPGNPGSAYVTFALLGIPLLRAMQGDAAPGPARVKARLRAPLRGAGERLAVAYGTLAGDGAEVGFTPGPHAPSGSVPALSLGGALALVPPGASLAVGDGVEVVDVDRP